MSEVSKKTGVKEVCQGFLPQMEHFLNDKNNRVEKKMIHELKISHKFIVSLC